ncbi:hypothetical protein MINTMi27_15520 [Mycobacterium intracellulare]|uniref:hypothetical protein n=1 Tax=Mycobacterium intracellulare TaxID=1767 RepID=UPI0019297C80|nr:hypothetical protein [Mycobacterium intracellulare]BCP41459.1 hypothetical protein MINTMi27_15520 [Mycobacterium intracellulare]
MSYGIAWTSTYPGYARVLATGEQIDVMPIANSNGAATLHAGGVSTRFSSVDDAIRAGNALAAYVARQAAAIAV